MQRVVTSKIKWEGKNPTLNPWLEFKLKGKTIFVLSKEDKDAIDRYNKGKETCDGTSIHLDAPPQPYIGDPDAPIWLLLMNPGYSPVDVAEITGVIPENLEKLINKKNLKFINFQEKSSPERRRGLMEDQLSFNQKSSFYPLEPDFDVWAYDGESLQGSYRWWRWNLLNGNICGCTPEKLSKFFVLESFPYHSRRFDDDHIKPWIHSESHCLFWIMMVVYALKNDNVLLCRGEKIAGRVYAIAKHIGHETDKIFVKVAEQKDGAYRYSQNFSASYGKFVSYQRMKAGTITQKDFDIANGIIRQKMGQ